MNFVDFFVGMLIFDAAFFFGKGDFLTADLETYVGVNMLREFTDGLIFVANKEAL